MSDPAAVVNQIDTAQRVSALEKALNEMKDEQGKLEDIILTLNDRVADLEVGDEQDWVEIKDLLANWEDVTGKPQLHELKSILENEIVKAKARELSLKNRPRIGVVKTLSNGKDEKKSSAAAAAPK